MQIRAPGGFFHTEDIADCFLGFVCEKKSEKLRNCSTTRVRQGRYDDSEGLEKCTTCRGTIRNCIDCRILLLSLVELDRRRKQIVKVGFIAVKCRDITAGLLEPSRAIFEPFLGPVISFHHVDRPLTTLRRSERSTKLSKATIS